jgi:predicted lipid carrier protein YhbT/chorismate mutase
VARGLIDVVDGAVLALLAARQRLAAQAALSKRRAGIPLHDAVREAEVRAHAQRVAGRFGLRPSFAREVLDVAIREARSRQPDAAASLATRAPGSTGAQRDTGAHGDSGARGARDARIARLLRWLPPPAQLAPLARRVPQRWQQRALEVAMARVLGPAIAAGDLAFLEGRCLGIEVTDLGLRWAIGLRDGRLASVADAPEASVRGTATDLLLLAGRVEDADTLFFQRRLVLTGDTELGLTARNLLEGLSWEAVPLGLRIGLARGARLARAARQARREGGRPGGDPLQQA